MGNFLKAFLTGLNEGRDIARNQSYRMQDENKFPVNLIEPSTGRIVKLRVTESNARVAQMYMEQLTTYAEELEQCGAQWTVTGKTIQIVMPNDNLAEHVRKAWRK